MRMNYVRFYFMQYCCRVVTRTALIYGYIIVSSFPILVRKGIIVGDNGQRDVIVVEDDFVNKIADIHLPSTIVGKEIASRDNAELHDSR